jgi:molecular chaperone HtpG
VSTVKVSRRLSKTPAIVVAGEYGWSANLERIMMSQAVSDTQLDQAQAKRGDRILEVNARHPLVEELKAKVRPSCLISFSFVSSSSFKFMA